MRSCYEHLRALVMSFCETNEGSKFKLEVTDNVMWCLYSSDAHESFFFTKKVCNNVSIIHLIQGSLFNMVNCEKLFLESQRFS